MRTNNLGQFKILGSAYWASYLINGDASGLDSMDKIEADRWVIDNLEPGDAIVDCGEPYFSWSYGLYTGSHYRGGDLVRYTVLRNNNV